MMQTAQSVHAPVMLAEVIDALSPRDGEVHLDGTFGAGGYTRAILDAGDTRVFAIDRDPEAIARGQDLTQSSGGRLTLLTGTFAEMETLLGEVGVTALDGVVLDLGLSSPQIDTPERGFSFRFDGPLDMRMSLSGPSAADVVNDWPEADLARIIWEYGEERFSRRIARSIVRERAEARIETTSRLAEIVKSCVPRSRDGIDPATRTFQALRIQVNDELGQLDRALAAAERILSPGGRLVVVAFHSLEDRRVKAFLKVRAGKTGGVSRHMPMDASAKSAPSFELIQSNALKPSAAETAVNPRARSARLRAARRTNAPVFTETQKA
ncbi:MAG: 16S rRNA (cytosine(1402)-N(4))-methyltransferase RsmH [Alphaproteobacteria bacterium]